MSKRSFEFAIFMKLFSFFSILGHPKIKVMKRAPVLNSFQEYGLIDIIPMHDQELLKRLKDEWFKAPLLGTVLFEMSTITIFGYKHFK